MSSVPNHAIGCGGEVLVAVPSLIGKTASLTPYRAVMRGQQHEQHHDQQDDRARPSPPCVPHDSAATPSGAATATSTVRPSARRRSAIGAALGSGRRRLEDRFGLIAVTLSQGGSSDRGQAYDRSASRLNRITADDDDDHPRHQLREVAVARRRSGSTSPIPGYSKMRSVMISPPMIAPMSMAATRHDRDAARCAGRGGRAPVRSLMPFARAVRR